jgi:hypothetical protein
LYEVVDVGWSQDVGILLREGKGAAAPLPSRSNRGNEHQESESEVCIKLVVLLCNYVPWTLNHYNILYLDYINTSAFFLGGRRGTRTPKHFVNLTGESKNFS